MSSSLKCFGVGDGWPCDNRNHSSFLYQLGKATLLIDCGESVSRGYKGSELSYDAVDRIFLSHMHSDHFAGLFMLMQGFWLEQRQKPLPIHLPAEGIEPLRTMFNTALLFEELFAFKPSYLPLRPAEPVEWSNVRVTAFPTTHLGSLQAAFQKKYPLAFECFGFVIETGKRRIVHTADLGSPRDLDPVLAQPVDLLVCELAHFRPRELFKYLSERPVARVIFVHVSRQYWRKLDATRELAARMLGPIPFHFAQDGEEIAI
jgi:ribonuclease Z